jgi:proteasome component ECM29
LLLLIVGWCAWPVCAVSQLCHKIVPRVLVALRSDAARGKALEVVKTLSSRVKSAIAVVLPLAEIYNVFANTEASPYEKNIGIMFLELGWKRAKAAEQAALVLRILPTVAAHAEQYQLTLLQMALSALEHVGTLTNTSWSSVTLEGAHATAVRSFLLDVLLFAPPGAGQARVQEPSPSAASSPGAAAASAPAAPAPLPPGLAAVGLERIQTKTQHGEGKGVPEYLLIRKIAVLKALTGKMLSDEHAFPLAVVASCGAHHEVRRMGEDLLRTLMQANRVDLDADSAAETIDTLFMLLLGNAEKIKRELQAGGGKAPAYMGGKSPALFVAGAVDVPTRVVLLAQLCRSVRAANTFPSALQAIFQGIYGADASMRLKQAAMQFAVWTTSNARAEVLKPMAPIILSGLLKFIKEGDSAAITNAQMVPLRGFTYSALGQLARRTPDLFRADVSIARQLFAALALEQPEVKVSVQEALSMSCLAYSGVSGADKEHLMSLLLEAIQNKDAHQARFCSVYWANRLFPFSDVNARYVCLTAVADPKIEVREEAERGLFLPSERGTPPSAAAQPISLLHTKDAEIKAAIAAEEYPPFEKIVEYLSSPDKLAARRSQSAGVKAATVALCNRCLAKSCEREGDITKRQYLTGASAPRTSTGGDQASAPREVAAEQMNLLIEDALVTALGGSKGVADGDLARQCLVALTDLQMARSDVVRRKYGGRLPWLENFLFSNNSDTRCVCVCVCARARVCVCVCVCVLSRLYTLCHTHAHC